jgi:mRNA interferase MazF
MVIRQGEVFWVDFGKARGSEPSGKRPALVVQSDRLNRTALATTVVVAVTSNLRWAVAAGNVRLRKGEGGLPRASVVNVSQLRTVDKAALVERAGRLSKDRMRTVIEGLDVVFELAD